MALAVLSDLASPGSSLDPLLWLLLSSLSLWDFPPGSILPCHRLMQLYLLTNGINAYSQHTEGHLPGEVYVPLLSLMEHYCSHLWSPLSQAYSFMICTIPTSLLTVNIALKVTDSLHMGHWILRHFSSWNNLMGLHIIPRLLCDMTSLKTLDNIIYNIIWDTQSKSCYG